MAGRVPPRLRNALLDMEIRGQKIDPEKWRRCIRWKICYQLLQPRNKAEEAAIVRVRDEYRRCCDTNMLENRS